MDNAALNKVLADADHEHFWIVLWGDPEHSADEDVQGFNEDFYDQGLARRPEATLYCGLLGAAEPLRAASAAATDRPTRIPNTRMLTVVSHSPVDDG